MIVTKSGHILTDADDNETENILFVSTIAQLMFFFWCFDRGIIAYAENNVNDIELDLRSYVKGDKASEPRPDEQAG